MKTLKSILFNLLAVAAIAVFMTSCSKEEAGIPEDAVITTETLNYKLSVPEGITPANTLEWFNQLSEEEIEAYLIEDSNITLRNCASWSSWSGWYYVSSGFSCFSLRCPNPQSESRVVRRRSRVRECAWGTEVQTQHSSTSTCGPPC